LNTKTKGQLNEDSQSKAMPTDLVSQTGQSNVRILASEMSESY